MKKCYKCGETKSFTDFHKNKSRPDGYQNYCKACAKIRNAEYYKNTPERNEQRRASNQAMRLKAQIFVLDYLRSHPCIDCPEYDPVVLDFDHIRGNKSFSISEGIRRGLSIEAIQEEMKKCVVRCANCHRRVTASRGGWFRFSMGP